MKTIVLTWIEPRSYVKEYGKPVAALWSAQGNEKSVDNALRYAETLNKGAVHIFDTDDPDWKRKAIDAHAKTL
jgi:hypothetical protein